MLANDKPVQYQGAEINNFNDLKEHISLDPQSSIIANRQREAANLRGRDLENNELTVQQK